MTPVVVRCRAEADIEKAKAWYARDDQAHAMSKVLAKDPPNPRDARPRDTSNPSSPALELDPFPDGDAQIQDLTPSPDSGTVGCQERDRRLLSWRAQAWAQSLAVQRDVAQGQSLARCLHSGGRS